MFYKRNIEKIIKEYNYSVWELAEKLLDTEEELNEKITELEKEIAEHNCLEK